MSHSNDRAGQAPTPLYVEAGMQIERGLLRDLIPQMRDLNSTDSLFLEMAAGQGRFERPRRQIRLLDRLCRSRLIARVCELCLGTGVVFFKDKLICKPPGADGYAAHRDIDFGWRRFISEALTVVVPFDSMTAENGCLELVLGSHRKPDHSTPDWLTVPLDVGDVLLFDSRTLHRSGPNRSTGNRSAYFMTFNSDCDGDQSTAYYEWSRQFPSGVRRDAALAD